MRRAGRKGSRPKKGDWEITEDKWSTIIDIPFAVFSCLFIISDPSSLLLPHEQVNYKANKKGYSNWLLFSMHSVMVALKFCPVWKCTITYTTFVWGFFSLLVNIFLRFPFLCHAWIGILFDIKRKHYCLLCANRSIAWISPLSLCSASRWLNKLNVKIREMVLTCFL